MFVAKCPNRILGYLHAAVPLLKRMTAENSCGAGMEDTVFTDSSTSPLLSLGMQSAETRTATGRGKNRKDTLPVPFAMVKQLNSH